MSVQRYTADGYGAQHGEMMPDPEGPWMLAADHARIVGEMEQAHAAALAEAEHATAFYREVSQLRAADARAAAPRTLTADDPYTRGLADARAAVDAVGRWRSFPDDTLLSRAAVLAAIDTLIHDGGAA